MLWRPLTIKNKTKHRGFRKKVLPVSKQMFWAKNSKSKLSDRLNLELLIPPAFF